MLDLLTNTNNLIFSIILFSAISMFLLELMTGGILDGLLPDLDLDLDFDLDSDFDLDVPEPGVISSLLGWAGANKVPLSIVIVSFMMLFGFSGLVIQSIFYEISGIYMWALIAAVPAVIVGFASTRILVSLLATVMPKEHNQAISMHTMIGKIATVYTTVSYTSEGLVSFSDQWGISHRMRAKSLNEKIFPKGDKVLLTEYDKGQRIFKVSRVPISLQTEKGS